MSRKRRGRGEGSITQRPDGLWCARITVGYNSNGKRVRRAVYAKSKAAVMQKLQGLQQRQNNGTLGEVTKTTVAQHFSNWLEHTVRTSVRSSTYESYKDVAERLVNPALGGVNVAKLTVEHVRAMLAGIESVKQKGYSRFVLRKALKQLVRDGVLARNVCDSVDGPKQDHDKPEMQHLTEEETRLFLEATEPDRLHAMYVLAITTGMRQGELYGLQPDDIDLDPGELSVRRTVSIVREKLVIGPPKTKKSRRRIKLSAMAVEALHAHRARMLAEGNAGAEWVFCNSQGGLLRRQNVQVRSFKPALKRAGLPDIRFHDLRHTAATLMLLWNINPKVVSEMLGHSKIAITMDLYSHVMPTMQHAAADAMDAKLGVA